ncbi:MAG: hypothetical protein CL599_19225 [Alteromonas sp.]|nr:hypothetical protein [Alteromonas sp.]
MRSGNVFSYVWKKSKDNSTSNVNSTASTSLEEHGQTPTNTCNVCEVELELGTNWTRGNKKKFVYFCRECDNAKRRANFLKQKAREIGDQTLKKYNGSKDGYVYIVTNPAWPEWVKIGSAMDADSRCRGYQTSSPFRDYIVVYRVYTKDRLAAEHNAFEHAEKLTDRHNEWFRMSVGQAKECIQRGL